MISINKYYYCFGNPIKIKFRQHFCYCCGKKLLVIKHKKIVKQGAADAHYYDFDIGVDGGRMVGDCEFIHKVFRCPSCNLNIEFLTQTSIEDVDILIDKLEKKFKHKDVYLSIKKSYEVKNKGISKDITDICEIDNLCLTIFLNNIEVAVFKSPILQKKVWERPYYFKINKHDLINFIMKIIQQKKSGV